MRKTGKLDYLELPVAPGSFDRLKAFYAEAFAWSFTDYGPTYAAFEEGLDGGFAVEPSTQKPLPILYSDDLEATLKIVEDAGGEILQPIYAFPGGRRFHFADPAGNELAVWSER
ncbi:MAG: VOC family protein [Rhizobiaceae bacterium]|nr:VOC family protein [Rhizobiaceae bacterium]